MKAPSFWYRSYGLTAFALEPFSLLWRAGGLARKILSSPYDGQKPSICIGNISVGGTGKTPAALAVARVLQQAGARPVFVSRGYGGRERGPLRVDPSRHTAENVGDESLLLARTAPVWIGRDRVAAIKQAEAEGSHILLDDGLQNPNIRPDVSLIVVDGETGFGNGSLLPAGPLREKPEEVLSRIAGVILIGADRQGIAKQVACPVLRASLEPRVPDDLPSEKKFFAFAGIGRPEKFFASCREAGLELAGTASFADHHRFTHAEIEDLQRKAGRLKARLVTTEKDHVRLPDDMRASVSVLPVALIFEDAALLERLINLPR
ncbi:MAG: tetraacyldisaccharide 4'-kinase [Bdellovibrionales bacterium]